jgi:hypothetical protein
MLAENPVNEWKNSYEKGQRRKCNCLHIGINYFDSPYMQRWVPLVAPEMHTFAEHMHSPRFLVGFVLLNLLFIVVFCRTLFFVLSFFLWPLIYCLSFFNLRLLITPLVSSNVSYDHP